DKLKQLRLRVLRDMHGHHPGANLAHGEDYRTESIAVSREALLLLRDADPQQARSLILELARKYNGKDRFYLEAIGIAVGHDKARRDVSLAAFEKQFPEWNDKVADLVWELQPPQLLPALEKRVTDSQLSPAQRGRVVEILAAYQEPEAGKALIKL